MASSTLPWADALTAAALALTDPAGLGGVWVRARHGPVRDAFIANVRLMVPPSAPYRRVNAAVDPARLLGGLDFAATLATGRSVMETGVLPSVSGGVLTLAMAERVPKMGAALIASALDNGCVSIERDGFSARLAARFVLLALDEGLDDEALPPPLADRLAFKVALDGLPLAAIGTHPYSAANVARARAICPSVVLPDDLLRALVQAALGAGRISPRSALFLCRAARATAALRGLSRATFEDAVVAVRLILGASAATSGEEAPAPSQSASEGGLEGNGVDESESAAALADRVAAAAKATLPEGLLVRAALSQNDVDQCASRRSDTAETAGARGPVVGVAARPPRAGARIDLPATLRAAAPWQAVRQHGLRPDSGACLAVTMDDFRYVRRRQPQGTTAIIVVDASGSAAAARLSETKGAIELLLAECYVRRDEVALVSFRGAGAETLLEPTRSLVRAKRSLAGLPGGGPTPLAHGIVAATELAHSLGRKGRSTIAVFLTDGRGNVGLDGKPGRDAAMSDATAAARRFRALGLRGVVIDTGTRPQAAVGRLAADLGADYVALPRGGAEHISTELATRLGR